MDGFRRRTNKPLSEVENRRNKTEKKTKNPESSGKDIMREIVSNVRNLDFPWHNFKRYKSYKEI